MWIPLFAVERAGVGAADVARDCAPGHCARFPAKRDKNYTFMVKVAQPCLNSMCIKQYVLAPDYWTLSQINMYQIQIVELNA